MYGFTICKNAEADVMREIDPGGRHNKKAVAR